MYLYEKNNLIRNFNNVLKIKKNAYKERLNSVFFKKIFKNYDIVLIYYKYFPTF